MPDSRACSNDGEPDRPWITLLDLVRSVVVCPSPEAFRRLRWLINSTLVGIALTIVLVVALRMPVPALPDLPELPSIPGITG